MFAYEHLKISLYLTLSAISVPASLAGSRSVCANTCVQRVGQVTEHSPPVPELRSASLQHRPLPLQTLALVHIHTSFRNCCPVTVFHIYWVKGTSVLRQYSGASKRMTSYSC